MNDDPEPPPSHPAAPESIPEAGPDKEPNFDEPSRTPPTVVDAPGRSAEF